MNITVEFEASAKEEVKIFNGTMGNDRIKGSKGRKLSVSDIAEILGVSKPAPDPVGFSGVMHPMVRFIDQTNQILVFERPPTSYPIEVYRGNIGEALAATKGRHKFNIALPWTVYVVAMTETRFPAQMWVYLSPHSLRNMHDMLYAPPMFNLYMDCKLCNPSDVPFMDSPMQISETIEQVFEQIWMSGFNYDLYHLIGTYAEQNYYDAYLAASNMTHEEIRKMSRVLDKHQMVCECLSRLKPHDTLEGFHSLFRSHCKLNEAIGAARAVFNEGVSSNDAWVVDKVNRILNSAR